LRAVEIRLEWVEQAVKDEILAEKAGVSGRLKRLKKAEEGITDLDNLLAGHLAAEEEPQAVPGLLVSRLRKAEEDIVNRTGSAHRRINEMNEQLVKRIKVLEEGARNHIALEVNDRLVYVEARLAAEIDYRPKKVEGRADNRTQGESELRAGLADVRSRLDHTILDADDRLDRTDARVGKLEERIKMLEGKDDPNLLNIRLTQVEHWHDPDDQGHTLIANQLVEINDRLYDLEHPPAADDPPVEPEQAGKTPCQKGFHVWARLYLGLGSNCMIAIRKCRDCTRIEAKKFALEANIEQIDGWAEEKPCT
jgi:hypothetical protein